MELIKQELKKFC